MLSYSIKKITHFSMLSEEKKTSLHHSLLVECFNNKTSSPSLKSRSRKMYQGQGEIQSREASIFRYSFKIYFYSRSDFIHYVISNLKINKS